MAFAVIGAAIEVHGLLGPGFLGSVYQQALAHELHLCSVPFDEQVRPPVTYKGQPVGYYVADFVVKQKLILEIKCISKLNSSHQAQAMHYLAATGLPLALLLNFGGGSLQHDRIIK